MFNVDRRYEQVLTDLQVSNDLYISRLVPYILSFLNPNYIYLLVPGGTSKNTSLLVVPVSSNNEIHVNFFRQKITIPEVISSFKNSNL